MDSPERRAVREALDSLKPYLQAWVEKALRDSTTSGKSLGNSGLDMQALVRVVIAEWDSIFSRLAKSHARTYFFELKDLRNRWAHEDEFTPDEVARARDTINQILRLIGAPKPQSPALVRHTALSESRKPNQRDTMRAIFARVGNDEERLIAEYAAAEKRGDVIRKRNKHAMSAEDYARALLKDAAKKGWLEE